MSITQCLVDLQAQGKIDPERAKRWGDEYERLAKEYGKTMGKLEAAEAASRDTLDALDRASTVQARQAMLQVGKQIELINRIGGDLKAGRKVGHVASSIMEHHEGAPGGPAVENTRGALYRLAWAKMGGFLGRYERDLLGRIPRGDELRELVRALRGEHTDNASAREMAQAVGDTFEWLRQQFNLAGGDIARLEGWGLPQSHDALAVAQAKFEPWWDFIRPLLDPARMIDTVTGKPFASDDALLEAGRFAWKAISSEGMDGQVPGQFRGNGKVANRRSDHRFFVFKDSDAWLAYNDRFGRSDPFDAIVSHVDSMTRDIAAMQVLGPNPGQTIRWISDLLQQDALPTMGGGKEIRLQANAKKAGTVMSDMWDYYSGALTAVPPDYRGTARFFSSWRNWNVMSKLGSAAISAVMTDPVFMGMTARFNGLPVMREMGNWLKLFAPGNRAHRELAEHAGLIFGEMTQRAEAIYRDGKLNVHELTRRGADGILRASLLSPHTVAAKQSLGLSFMMDWADHAGRSFDSLEAPKRQSLERYGIDAADWDRLRAVPAYQQGGRKLLRPGDLAREGSAEGLATATKFMSLIDSETRFGVPGESLRAQTAVATFGGGARLRRGTIPGELLHSANQFKTYSVIMAMTHFQRAMYGPGTVTGKLAYALALPTFLTVGGFVANELLDIAQGKDPSPAFTKLSLGRAFARGGGLGIIGDLIQRGMSDQHGGPISGFLVGPTIGSVVDPAVSLTLGNISKAAEDKDTTVGAEAVRMFRQAMPGSNLWYTRLAFNRLWADQMQQWADPNYAQSWARMEQRATQEGSQYWWGPNDPAFGSRAPDLSNISKTPEPQP